MDPAGLARGSCSPGICALPLPAPDEGLKVKMDYLFLSCLGMLPVAVSPQLMGLSSLFVQIIKLTDVT